MQINWFEHRLAKYLNHINIHGEEWGDQIYFEGKEERKACSRYLRIFLKQHACPEEKNIFLRKKKGKESKCYFLRLTKREAKQTALRRRQRLSRDVLVVIRIAIRYYVCTEFNQSWYLNSNELIKSLRGLAKVTSLSFSLSVTFYRSFADFHWKRLILIQ